MIKRKRVIYIMLVILIVSIGSFSFGEDTYNVTIEVGRDIANTNNAQIYELSYLREDGGIDSSQLNDTVEIFFDKNELNKEVPEDVMDLLYISIDAQISIEQINYEDKTRLNIIDWEISPSMYDSYSGGPYISDTITILETLEKEDYYLKSRADFKNTSHTINVIDYREYENELIPNDGYIGKKLKVAGNLNTESDETYLDNILMIPLEVEPTEDSGDEEIVLDENEYEIVFNLENLLFKNPSNAVYSLENLVDDGGINQGDLEEKKNVYFRSKLLKDNMPKEEDIKYDALGNNTIKAIVTLEHLPESGLTRFVVKEWNFVNPSGWAGNVMVEEIIYRDEYYLKAKVDSDEINYIIIDDRLSAEREIPANGYVGKYLKVTGEKIEESGTGVLYVTDYIQLLKEKFKEEVTETEQEIEVYGTLVKSLYREDYERIVEDDEDDENEETDNDEDNNEEDDEDVEKERIINQVYEFKDENGNKYYAYFSNQEVVVPAENEEGRPVKIIGTIKDENLEYGSLYVKSFTLLDEERFGLNEKEFAQIDVKLSDIKESNSSYTVYDGIMKDDKRVELIVESDISKEFGTIPLNKTISVTVFVNEISDNRIIMTTVAINKGTELKGDEKLIVDMVSSNDEEIIYQVNGYDNKVEEITFNKDILKDNFPKNSIVGKKIIYSLVPGTNNVIAWKVMEESTYASDTGKILELISETDHGITYKFKSEKGNEYNIFLPKNAALIDTLLIEDPKDLFENTFKITGLFNHNKHGRIFILKSLKYTNESYRDLSDNKEVTVRGTVIKRKSKTTNGSVYLVEDGYGKSYIINVSEDLNINNPLYNITGEKIIAKGYILKNGIILVNELKFSERKFTKLPIENESPYSIADRYPNMQVFCGKLELFTVDKTYYTLKTTSRKFAFSNTKEHEEFLDQQLTKYIKVYGQVYGRNYPQIEKHIDLYKVESVDSCSEDTMYSAGEYEGTKYKDSIYTEQPKSESSEFEFGIGLYEGLYLERIEENK